MKPAMGNDNKEKPECLKLVQPLRLSQRMPACANFCFLVFILLSFTMASFSVRLPDSLQSQRNWVIIPSRLYFVIGFVVLEGKKVSK